MCSSIREVFVERAVLLGTSSRLGSMLNATKGRIKPFCPFCGVYNETITA
jgi:hypothetical protein